MAVTAIGRLPRGTMVHRGGARPGDLLYVSGTIGDAALGLALRLAKAERKSVGRVCAAHLLDRYLHPQPRLALAPAVRRYASAALDVSDGLVGDFGHICEVSGVSGVIEASPGAAVAGGVPLHRRQCRRPRTRTDRRRRLRDPRRDRAGDAAAFERAARRAGVAVTRIGLVTKGQGSPTVLGSDGRPLAFGHASFDHFAR